MRMGQLFIILITFSLNESLALDGSLPGIKIWVTGQKDESGRKVYSKDKEEKKKKKHTKAIKGNLPYFVRSTRRTGFELTGEMVISATEVLGRRFKSIKPGELLRVRMDQKILVSRTIPMPIRGEIIAGEAKGGILTGEAKLDLELKRVLIQFERLLAPGAQGVYALLGTVLSLEGDIGLFGEHHSGEGKYFLGEITAAAASGFADATIQRDRNAFGMYEKKPSLGTAGKEALVKSLSSTAEFFGEKLKEVPEYTVVDAGQVVKVFIKDYPRKVETQ